MDAIDIDRFTHNSGETDLSRCRIPLSPPALKITNEYAGAVSLLTFDRFLLLPIVKSLVSQY